MKSAFPTEGLEPAALWDDKTFLTADLRCIRCHITDDQQSKIRKMEALINYGKGFENEAGLGMSL